MYTGDALGRSAGSGGIELKVGTADSKKKYDLSKDVSNGGSISLLAGETKDKNAQGGNITIKVRYLSCLRILYFMVLQCGFINALHILKQSCTRSIFQSAHLFMSLYTHVSIHSCYNVIATFKAGEGSHPFKYGGGSGGNIKINGGAASGGSREYNDGGNIQVIGGSASAGTGGGIHIRSGHSDTHNSGDLTIETHISGSKGHSGSMNISSGASYEGDSGYVFIKTGDADNKDVVYPKSFQKNDEENSKSGGFYVMLGISSKGVGELIFLW